MSISCIWPDISVTILLLYFQLYSTRLCSKKSSAGTDMHMADSHVAVKDDYELINVQNFGIKERKREEEQAGEGEVKTESPQKQMEDCGEGVIKTPNVVKIAEDTTFCGGQRRRLGSEEKFQLRPCVSFGHSCCEWTSVPGKQPVVCISIMLPVQGMPCGSTLPLLFGLRAAIYLCDWPQHSRLLPADFTLLLFHSFGFSFVIAEQTHKSTQRKPHLG